MTEEQKLLIERLPAEAAEQLLKSWQVTDSRPATDLAVECLEEPPPVPLTSFHLGHEDHRREFLWEYYWQGEPTLFAAVAHVWDSLDGDRVGHGTLVGLLSGTGGIGKTAIILTLQRFLRECLAGATLLPRREDFSSMEEWHQAVQQSFVNDEDHARALCVRYSAILDGRPPVGESDDDSLAPSRAKVLVGPWRAAVSRRGRRI